MTLRTRVLGLIAASVTLILLLGWQLTVRYEQTGRNLSTVVESLAPALAAANDLDADISDMDRRLRIYVAGGETGYLLLYQRATAQAEANLRGVRRLVGAQQAYRVLLRDVRSSLADWQANVGDPATSAMAAGRTQIAAEIVGSPLAQASFSRLTADTYRLTSLLNSDQAQALAASARAASKLAWTIAVALPLLLVIPLGAFLVLRRSVLRPIGNLRRQLAAAAQDETHHAVIAPSGPPELQDLGRDAEALRRNLVHQLDEASAARTALEQEGPVVQAIRTELRPNSAELPIGVQVAGVLRPAEGVLAGDFWDRIPLGDGRTAVIVCDVSGHGPRAGIVALRIKTGINMGLLAGSDPATIFHRACDGFSEEPGRFATCVILITDPRTGTVEWANAGHPKPRVLRPGGRIEMLDTTGPMLSWLGGTWTSGTTRLGPADLCLCFTDGVLESRDEHGHELGDDGLDERLVAAATGTTDPDEVVAHALAGVRERAQDLGRDDVTLIAIRLDPRASGAIPNPRR